jgi:hypothetical protein
VKVVQLPSIRYSTESISVNWNTVASSCADPALLACGITQRVLIDDSFVAASSVRRVAGAR